MNTVISQPRYLPALNYLQRLKSADKFILLDTVQRQGRGWENRNKMLLPSIQWLTIPIASSSREVLCKTIISNDGWVAEHKKRIRQYYADHPYYDEKILDVVYADLHAGQEFGFPVVISRFIQNTCDLLEFSPQLISASELETEAVRMLRGPEKLAELVKLVGGDRYISGPNGKAYGVESAFAQSGIDVVYHNFEVEPYSQPNQNHFIPYMGFLDAIFCMGLPAVKSLVYTPFNLEAL